MSVSARAKRASDLETWLAAAPPKGRGSLEVLLRDGSGPAILTAVHSVRHWRLSKWKSPDRFTGPLAVEAARAAECRALVLAAPTYADSNFDENSGLKEWLSRLAERPGSFVIDVHGMKDRGSDIIVGTAQGLTPAPLADAVLAAAAAAGFTALVSETGHLSASRSSTITSYSISTLGVPAVQLELAPSLRDPREHSVAFDRVVKFLADVARWS
jgi:hypothetical protein